jgi:hypothetical protein
MEDFFNDSAYGVNAKGKVGLCESCAYAGYCMKGLRFYKCNNYIKRKEDVFKA